MFVIVIVFNEYFFIFELESLYSFVNIDFQVKCIQMKGTENVPAPSIGFPSKDEMVQDSSGLCHIIEIKDAYLPPWIINRVCAIMGAEERSFEVR